MKPSKPAKKLTGQPEPERPLYIDLMLGISERGMPYHIKPGCETQPLDTIIREALALVPTNRWLEESRTMLLQEYTPKARITIRNESVSREEPLTPHLSRAVIKRTSTGKEYLYIQIRIEPYYGCCPGG